MSMTVECAAAQAGPIDLPSYVTPEWLADKIDLPEADLAKLHTNRTRIAAISGFSGWPDEHPDLAQFRRLAVEGFRHPFFVMACNSVLNERESGSVNTSSTSKTIFDAYKFSNKLRLLQKVAKRLRRGGTDLVGALVKLRQFDEAATHAFLLGTSVVQAEALLTTLARFKPAERTPRIVETEHYLVEVRRSAEERFEFCTLEGNNAYGRLMEELLAADGTAPQSEDETGFGLSADHENPEPIITETASVALTAEMPRLLGSGDDQPERSGEAATAAHKAACPPVVGNAESSAVGAIDADRALDEWREALEEAQAALADLSSDAPDSLAVGAVSAILERARAAALVWQEAQPRGVDSADLKRRLRELAAAIEHSTKIDQTPLLHGLEGIDRVLENAIARAEDEYAAAECCVAESHRLEAEAQTLAAAVSSGLLSKQERASKSAAMHALWCDSAENETRASEHIVAAVCLLADGRVEDIRSAPARAAVSPEAPEPHPSPKKAAPASEAAGSAGPSAAASDAMPAHWRNAELDSGAVTPGSSEAETVLTVEPLLAMPDDDLQDDGVLVMEGEAEPVEDADGAVTAPHAEPLPTTAVLEPERDPLAEEFDERITALLEVGEVGLAYHFAVAATEVEPDYRPPFCAAELRFMAEAGHVNYADAAADPEVVRMIDAAYEAASIIPDDDSDNAIARRLALSAAALEVALFMPSTNAEQILRNTDAEVFGSHLYAVRRTVLEAAHRRIPVTLPMMRMLATNAKNDADAEQLRRSIIETIEAKPSEFRLLFVQGVKVVNRIFKDSDVSRLRDGLADQAKAFDAAKAFVAAYGTRNAVHDLINAISDEIDPKDRIVGPARDKITRAVEDVIGNCRSFVAIGEAKPALDGAKQRAELHNVREDLLAGLERAVSGLERLMPDGRLTKAAVGYAVRILRRLDDTLCGRVDLPGTTDRLMAVHGPLMWLPGLRFADSWLPSAYDPQAIIEIICRASLPVVRHGNPEAFRAVVAARMQEHSYVPARILAEAASFYGAPEKDAAAIRDEIGANEQMCRSQVRSAVERAKRQVSMTQRLGVGSDELDLLYDRLQAVQLDELSVRTTPATLLEERHGERVLDFAAVDDLIADIDREVERLTRPKRKELCSLLEELKGKVDAEDAEKVRAQIESRNLMEGEELLTLLKENKKLPPSRRVNRAFAEYYPAVPDWLDAEGGRIEGAAIAAAIRAGQVVGPLNFGRVLGRLREQAALSWEAWLDLKASMDRGLTDNVIASAAALLGRLGLHMQVTPGAPVRPPIQFRMSTAEVQIEENGARLLLPEFGSLSHGDYRLCLVGSELAENDVDQMCDVGKEPVLLLVGGPISRARRAQIALVSLRRQRPVLVIDESLVLYALSEHEPRRMALFECAQPFSWAAPYKDYGRDPVPAEMFVGRSRFLGGIADDHGGFIVFGGRRLGKTALLLRAQAMHHRPDEGQLCAYLDCQLIGRSGGAVKPSAIWNKVSSSENLKPVFSNPVQTAESFAEGVKRWLGLGKRRRLLLLLDETEGFVEADASGMNGQPAFSVFLALQRLMTDTEKRFKFALAGLHNVSRIIRAQNSPLKHVAQDAIRVGPLILEDRTEAERLLTHPLAALGIEFEERIDVWRILTKANYYPVLIHTFCQTLLARIQAEWLAKGRIPEDRRITSEMVSEMLDDRRLSDGLQHIFDLTITGCDQRYAVIAYAAAHRWYTDVASGIPHDGVTPLEVRDVAAAYWPKVFDGQHGLALIEDLMDEMETLGVLRNVDRKRWTLRSKMIVDYLGSREEVRAKLEAFRDLDEPDSFDVRSVRREITVTRHRRDQKPEARQVLSPLTVGQEYDILSGGTPVRVLFGNALSEVAQVPLALRDARRDTEGPPTADIVMGVWSSAEDLAAEIAKYRREEGLPGLFVVERSADWDVSWINSVLDQRAVKDRRVRVLFVGDHAHAWRWVTHPATENPITDVRDEPLGLWPRRSISGWLRRLELPAEPLADRILAATGGFHRHTAEMLRNLTNRKADAAEKFVTTTQAAIMKDAALPELIGLAHVPVATALRTAHYYADADRRVSAYEIGEALGAAGIRRVAGMAIVRYGLALGLLNHVPSVEEVAEDERLYALNPLVDTVLTTMFRGSKVKGDAA